MLATLSGEAPVPFRVVHHVSDLIERNWLVLPLLRVPLPFFILPQVFSGMRC